MAVKVVWCSGNIVAMLYFRSWVRFQVCAFIFKKLIKASDYSDKV